MASTRPAATAAPPIDGVPQASVRDSAAVLAGVLGPLVGRGIIKRRRSMTGLAARVDADRRAVQQMQALRRKYGPGPLLLRTPARSVAVVLDAGDVRRILDETPEPFASATIEKRAALGHFQPEGLLVSHGEDRAERRRFNEEVLDTGRPHRCAEDLVARAHDDAARLAALASRVGALTYEDFIAAWWRMVRRVVLGDGAADDHVLTDQLAALRDDANWAYLRPRRRSLRDDFLWRLGTHVAAAEPGSLAHLVHLAPPGPRSAPVQQIPQWLFAFDAAAIATYRALALLATHADHADRVLHELDGRDMRQPQHLPLVRATVLESLRLWPTTPAVLRDTTSDTEWATGTVPAGTSMVIYAPFFHRDDEHLPEANRLAVDLWDGDGAAHRWPLIPFSAGPGVCAGKDLVLLVTGVVLGTIVQRCDLRLGTGSALRAGEPLPGTLSPFSLRFATRAKA